MMRALSFILLSSKVWRNFGSLLNMRFAEYTHPAKRRFRGAITLFCALLFALPLAAAERVEMDNGDLYEGDLVDGVRTGTGVYVWADGKRYEGEFLNNKLHGEGVFTEEGRTYVGGFVNDRREGQGRLEWENGNVYEGSFVNGVFEGIGKVELAIGSHAGQ